MQVHFTKTNRQSVSELMGLKLLRVRKNPLLKNDLIKEFNKYQRAKFLWTNLRIKEISISWSNHMQSLLSSMQMLQLIKNNNKHLVNHRHLTSHATNKSDQVSITKSTNLSIQLFQITLPLLCIRNMRVFSVWYPF